MGLMQSTPDPRVLPPARALTSSAAFVPTLVLASALSLSLTLPARAAGDDRATEAGTVASFLVPLGTAAVEAWRGDREGLGQLTLTWTSTVAVAEVLKNTTGKTRPDRTNDLSFPSGHAARAFGAAAYVNRRHGFEVAWPLYAASLAVGWTRVQAQRHDWVDVAGSAVLAELMARTWTTRTRAPAVAAMKTPDGWSVQLQLPL